MEFRIEYKSRKSPLRLSAHRNLLFFGSCFSENICRKLMESLWPAFNPAGVLYNPASIAAVIENVLPGSFSGIVSEVRHDGISHNMMLDSGFSAGSSREMREKTGRMTTECRERLNAGADLVVTFGTSFVYTLENLRRLENHEAMESRIEPFIVGNCHKLPASDFSRRRLGVEEIVDRWAAMIERLQKSYPSTRIILTVSPVRHLKDGFEGNSLSKATLRLAVEEIVKGQDPSRISYFPSYEILNDDLRDYRFYARDMVHPSEEAVDYIFDLFKATYIPDEDIELMRRGRDILRGWLHRPIIPDPDKETDRKSRLKAQTEALHSLWPEMQFNQPTTEH